jgi:hypothetical protein
MDNDEKLYIFNKLINKYPIYILKKEIIKLYIGDGVSLHNTKIF